MNHAPSVLLRASIDGNLFWKEVDEGWIGYAEQPGNTFLIDPFSRFVLDAIRACDDGVRESELPEWLNMLAPELAVEELTPRLGAALTALRDARLIETIASNLETR